MVHCTKALHSPSFLIFFVHLTQDLVWIFSLLAAFKMRLFDSGQIGEHEKAKRIETRDLSGRLQCVPVLCIQPT